MDADDDYELECDELVDTQPQLYCHCRAAVVEGEPMIACDAPDCPIEWFYFSCVGITVTNVKQIIARRLHN